MTWYTNCTKFAVYIPAEFILAVTALQTISIAENRNSNLAIFVLLTINPVSTLHKETLCFLYSLVLTIRYASVVNVVVFLSSACFPWIIRIIHDVFTIDRISCIWPDL